MPPRSPAKAASKKGPSANGKPKKPSLPPMTVGKAEDVMVLVEQMVAEKTDLFATALHDYREVYRERTSRPLSAQEAVGLAAGMAAQLDEDPIALAERYQGSELRAHDEPEAQEALLAAGLSTAPAFMEVARRVCALIEMPSDTYREASEADVLDEAIDTGAAKLRDIPLGEGRKRCAAALAFFAAEAGVGGEGKAWATVANTVLTALTQAVGASPFGSSTSSLVPTDGPPLTSDTEPATATP